MSDATHTLRLARGAFSSAHLRMRRARRVLFYWAVLGMTTSIRSIPASLARGGLRLLGHLAWWLLPADRRVALAQLRHCFPARSEAWRRWVARQAYLRLADNLVSSLRGDESVWVDRGSRDRLEVIRRSGRPVIVLLGHYGAWELAGPVLAAELNDFAALTANPHNERVDAWLREQRERRGIVVFDRDDQRLAAAKWLRRGGTLAVLADHRSGTTRPAPWFDSMVPTVVGPARLARWADAVIVAAAVRGGPGHYELVVGPTLENARERSEDDISSWCNAASEAWIREDPTQWTWWHDRMDIGGRAS